LKAGLQGNICGKKVKAAIFAIQKNNTFTGNIETKNLEKWKSNFTIWRFHNRPPYFFSIVFPETVPAIQPQNDCKVQPQILPKRSDKIKELGWLKKRVLTTFGQIDVVNRLIYR
jgi:hypothetical protein